MCGYVAHGGLWLCKAYGGVWLCKAYGGVWLMVDVWLCKAYGISFAGLVCFLQLSCHFRVEEEEEKEEKEELKLWWYIREKIHPLFQLNHMLWLTSRET